MRPLQIFYCLLHYMELYSVTRCINCVQDMALVDNNFSIVNSDDFAMYVKPKFKVLLLLYTYTELIHLYISNPMDI